MWKEQRVNLGMVKSGTRNIAVFTYEGDIDLIADKITTSCTCTNPSWNSETKTMTVVYTPKPVPKHLTNMKLSYYNDLKEISFFIRENGIQKEQKLHIQAMVSDNI